MTEKCDKEQHVAPNGSMFDVYSFPQPSTDKSEAAHAFQSLSIHVLCSYTPAFCRGKAGIKEMDHLTNLSSSDRKTAHAMTVAFISEGGAFQTMWLPADMEGRYRFRGELGFHLPLYFESDGSQWTAYAEKNAYFLAGKDTDKKALPLTNQLIAKLYSGDRMYALYAEISRLGDNVFLPYRLESGSDYTIGRNMDNQISYPNAAVSRIHATLCWDRDAWKIIDQNSSNGVYVNGRQVQEARLGNGDVIYIMGCLFL